MASQPETEPLPPWIFAISGSAASVVANSLIYPLDRVKTKLQVQSLQDATSLSEDAYYTGVFDAVNKIVCTEGVPGLYAGLPGSLIGSAAQGYAFNYWHSFLRQLYISSSLVSQPPGTVAELALAYCSGALAQLCTTPISVVTARQQTTPVVERKGLIGTANEVMAGENGPTGLWKGFRASLILCVNPAITYGATERLRMILFKGKATLKPWESFFLGVLSKAMATLITQPMIVAKIALQSRPPPSRKGEPFKSIGEVIAWIVKNEGVLRLYKGLGPQLSKALLFQGILMLVKERIRNKFALVYFYMQRMHSTQARGLAAGVAGQLKVMSPIIMK